jgi:hypothetical protein
MIIKLPAKIRSMRKNIRHSFDQDTFFGDLFLINDNGKIVDITNNHKDIISNSSAITNSYIYLNGSESRIIVKDHKRKLNFGAEDFTIDWWEYTFNDSEEDQLLFNNGSINIKNTDFKTVCMFDDSNLQEMLENDFKYKLKHEIWAHWAIVRSSNYIFLINNGKIIKKVFSDKVLLNTNKYLVIGGQNNSYFHGMISNFRITKDIALWIEDFDLKNELYY